MLQLSQSITLLAIGLLSHTQNKHKPTDISELEGLSSELWPSGIFLRVGESCPVGYSSGADWDSCYRVEWRVSLNYSAALVACQREGAQLVSLESLTQLQQLASLLLDTRGQ